MLPRPPVAPSASMRGPPPPGPPPAPPPRAVAFWPLWAAAILLPLLLFAGGGLSAWHAVDAEIRQRLAQTVDLLHEHALRAFETQDAVLMAMQGVTDGMSWEEIASSRALADFSRGLAGRIPVVSTVGMVSPAGRLVQIGSATTFPPPSIDLSDRDYVAAQRNAERDLPFVGAAVHTRVHDHVVFPYSRPRLGADGRPDGGTLWGTFRVSDFMGFYAATAALSGDMVALARSTDGSLLVRQPPLSRPTGHTLPLDSPPMLAAARGEGRVGFAEGVSPLDGQYRIYAARRGASLPVAVIYGMHASVRWGAWTDRMVQLGGVASAASVMLLGLTWLVWKRTRAQVDALGRAQAEAERRALSETARADAEAALREGQRLEALGQIAAGVAHDFSNHVHSVSAAAHLLRKAAHDPQRVLSLVALLEQSSVRGAVMARRVLNFARKDFSEAEDRAAQVFDPRAGIIAACDLLTRSFGAGHRVRWSVGEEVPALLRGATAEIELTLINLGINARDAMPEGGEVVIAASAVRDPPGVGAGLFGRITVTDAGIGMDAATLARASEAFFTTKPRGKGTGLGLSMARALVEGLGGALRIESEPGRGTTVSLWLPAAGPADRPE